jgi:alkanesulfonate monooxygenase SsuD/methylene tetrahydromethanopterin reductase-like flavin-dependent oxidoreductase (luciferase family)
MKFALNIGNFGWASDVDVLLEVAVAAEEAGWDGLFLWDHVNFAGVGGRHADPWIALGVIASQTRTLRLGTGITPLPRRRPAKLAQEILTLDALSGGRFVLGIGSGAGDDSEYADLGEETNLATRAAMLDEGLEVLQGLLSDRPLDFDGEHYRAKGQGFGPPASGKQIPIWLAATWPKKKPSRRALRFDGIFPLLDPYTKAMTPKHVAEIAAFVAAERESPGPFEIVVTIQGEPESSDAARRHAAAFEEAGTTWYMVPSFPPVEPKETLLRRVRRGPQRP